MRQFPEARAKGLRAGLFFDGCTSRGWGWAYFSFPSGACFSDKECKIFHSPWRRYVACRCPEVATVAPSFGVVTYGSVLYI